MARRFEDGKREYRFLMKLFLSLKLPPIDTFGSLQFLQEPPVEKTEPPVEKIVLEEEVQWGERDAKNDGGRCGEDEMDVGMKVRVPLAPSSTPCSPPANLQCNKNSFFLSFFFLFGFHLNCLP